MTISSLNQLYLIARWQCLFYIWLKWGWRIVPHLYCLYSPFCKKGKQNSENTHLIFYIAKIYDVLDDNGIAFSSRSYAVSWKWKHKHPREKIKVDKGKDIIINKFFSSSSFSCQLFTIMESFLYILYIWRHNTYPFDRRVQL